MPHETRTETPRAAAPTGPRDGADKDHPVPLNEYNARRATGTLDPNGTWITQKLRNATTKEEETVIRFAPTPPPGSVYDYPMSLDDFTRLDAAGKITWTYVYVKLPGGSTQTMHPTPPGVRR